MLGRLAKWLRIAGYDTEYFTNKDKKLLTYQSLKQGRIIITRDHRLSKHKALKIVILKSDDLDEQLRQLAAELGIKFDTTNLLSRCTLCNSLIQTIDKDKVKSKVPDFVFNTQQQFFWCNNCKKIYWPGTHLEFIKTKISKL